MHIFAVVYSIQYFTQEYNSNKYLVSDCGLASTHSAKWQYIYILCTLILQW